MKIADLPLLDEHATAIVAGADEVWPIRVLAVRRLLTGVRRRAERRAAGDG